MTDPIEFTAVFAQGAQAIKPQHDPYCRLWIDAWLSDMDQIKCQLLWRENARLKIRIEVEQ